ncbi:NADH-quinone oxidoreductase subunit L [Oleomonas cavernae]|uniref:NADH-quinone oxidoreductase subunit L n=1 Tax=Oleomonas cavernae TaxID=2320859 RepID=A0A418WC02_9PROT|nr:NADH-quinone oxidoreductase subunit L [Oleomonas cavernae]RJF87458.1 NADH-quinone oxidoreductase subunit L [Oleomonas cavernae]
MIAAIVFLPLLGAIIVGFFGRRLGNRGAQVITSGFLVVAAVLSWITFFQATGHATDEPLKVHLFTWMLSGSLEVEWAFRIDALTAVMLVVVNTVSSLVHIYSAGYMEEDPHIPRFQAYLSLFTFAMLMLVTADNFVQVFFGWEGVGLASYLLIGFWYKKPSANAAAIKAFVVNRVGDFGFALGIFAIFFVFNSVSFDTVFAAAAGETGKTFNFLGYDVDILTTICLLLFVGCMGKSAQLGLHTWLPDAMEGPTPVSALIHAATMVTAGVFLVARCSPLFEHAPVALEVVTIVGASTAFFAATVGLVQNDIKRVIAYSTCSQLGYMFFAAGVGAYEASIFHLFTHAFFKALLFLGAGSVIHAMHHEQDMRNMGGLWRHIKLTYALMWIGNLALAGIPLFAGYYSKDTILEVAFAAHTGVGTYAYILGTLAAMMTAFYSWRLLFMTFHGEARWGHGHGHGDHGHGDHGHAHTPHESPLVMTIPLIVLALGAAAAGIIFFDDFVGHHREAFWGGAIFVAETNKVLEEAHHIPEWAALLPLVLSVFGIFLAWVFYIARPKWPAALAQTHKELYAFLLNKWYFDELYDLLFVRPAKAIGRLLWKGGDGRIIDGLGPDGISARVLDIARRAVKLQSGFVYHYAFAMLIGVAALVSWYVYRIGVTP